MSSAAALLFEIWLSGHLRSALLARVAPDIGLRKFLMPGNITTVVRVLEGAYPELSAQAGLVGDSERTAFLCETLLAAWNDACVRFGGVAGAWRWGDLHKG